MPKENLGVDMLFVKLLDIYKKINSCPRKMVSLQALCSLGDAHRDGVTWVNVTDLSQDMGVDIGNLRSALKQMEELSLVEKCYLDKSGEITNKVTRSGVVVRLVDECIESLGGKHVSVV